MKLNIIKYPDEDDWKIVKIDALTTVWKKFKNLPDSTWKQKMLASEHSPIRDLVFHFTFEDIKSWITVHLVRHHEGIEKFVSTQRNDRQENYDREIAPQNSLVNMKISVNAQSIMDISRKRLCKKADPQTIKTWQTFVDSLEETIPELHKLCVPNCIYRNGICSEFEPCGYNKTKHFEEKRKEYLEIFEK